MFCGKCGNSIPAEAQYCGHCGAPTAQTQLAERTLSSPVLSVPKSTSQRPLTDRLIKPSIAIGILLIGSSAAYYFIFALPQIQKARLDAQLRVTLWDQEQQCSKRAEAIFNESNWGGPEVFSSGYENHFNQKLNKCFMLVTVNSNGLDGSLFFSKTLFDVNAGTQSSLGHWNKQVPRGVADYSVKPFACGMLDEYCQTDEEFDAFVKTYMEQ